MFLYKDIGTNLPTGEFIAYKKAIIVTKKTCHNRKCDRILSDEVDTNKPYDSYDTCIVKLKIPEDALRVNPKDPTNVVNETQPKCRANKAIVLGFENLVGEKIKLEKNQMVISLRATFKKIIGWHVYYKLSGAISRGEYIVYEKGKCVESNKYDPDNYTICSDGIHFFMSKYDAREYDI